MTTQVSCSFCGRNKADVELMISGINAHICNHCISQAQNIVKEEVSGKVNRDISDHCFILYGIQVRTLFRMK